MLVSSLSSWLIFGGIILAAIVVDLVLLYRHPHSITLRQAAMEILFWIGVALAFNAWIYFSRGPKAGLEFLTAYTVEQSLSVDNIFVFLLIFRAFQIPPQSQHRVLYDGLAGAAILRALFIFAGVALLNKIHFVLYLFGALLVITGIRMLFTAGRELSLESNWAVRLAARFRPICEDPSGQHFWLKQSGRWSATPLFLALLAVEAMDIVFAVDSVPAVLAITRDTFVAYSSNVFAILGLRALYFGLAGVLPRLRFLHHGLATLLIFIGGKMVLSERAPVSTAVSLAAIALILAAAVIASLAWPVPSRDRAR